MQVVLVLKIKEKWALRELSFMLRVAVTELFQRGYPILNRAASNSFYSILLNHSRWTCLVQALWLQTVYVGKYYNILIPVSFKDSRVVTIPSSSVMIISTEDSGQIKNASAVLILSWGVIAITCFDTSTIAFFTSLSS
jgi:hypothetical protein